MLRLKEVRTRKKNLSQAQVARDLEISRQSYNFYENGKREPTPQMLNKMADYFEVSLDYLLGRDETEKTLSINENSLKLNKKDQNDLNKFLNQAEIMFDGDTYKLNTDDREKIRSALKLAFYDAKKRNKRKKD